MRCQGLLKQKETKVIAEERDIIKKDSGVEFLLRSNRCTNSITDSRSSFFHKTEIGIRKDTKDTFAPESDLEAQGNKQSVGKSSGSDLNGGQDVMFQLQEDVI